MVREYRTVLVADGRDEIVEKTIKERPDKISSKTITVIKPFSLKDL